MPKCQKCGKKFNSLQALKNHFNAVHPNERFVAPKESMSRNLMVTIVVIIVVVGAVIGGLIYVTRAPSTTTDSASIGILGSPINYTLYQNLTGVSWSTLAAVGNGASDVTQPSAISGSPLTNGTKPEILYIGAEFCPYCAAERWALVVALSKFGNFSGLEYMQSAPNDGNITTLTFLHANYTSKYIDFITVENEDRNHNTLQVPTGQQQTLWQDLSGNQLSYPTIDFGGQYSLTTSQYTFGDLTGLSWTQIGSQLNNPNSKVAKEIDGAANGIISVVCTLTNKTPTSICGQSYLSDVAVAYTTPANGGVSSSLQAVVNFPTIRYGAARVGKFTF
jgi:hypothetical protein